VDAVLLSGDLSYANGYLANWDFFLDSLAPIAGNCSLVCLMRLALWHSGFVNISIVACADAVCGWWLIQLGIWFYVKTTAPRIN
jgi:ABC-type proline/glycine betaine transport system permease subunit